MCSDNLLTKLVTSAVPKPFCAPPKSEFGEHLVTQASNSVFQKHETNNDCMDDYGQ